MRKKETPNPSRVRGRGVEVSETLFYCLFLEIINCPDRVISQKQNKKSGGNAE